MKPAACFENFGRLSPRSAAAKVARAFGILGPNARPRQLLVCQPRVPPLQGRVTKLSAAKLSRVGVSLRPTRRADRIRCRGIRGASALPSRGGMELIPALSHSLEALLQCDHLVL